MVEPARPSFLGREFTAGVQVGTAITVVVGLVFVFLGASVDDAPAPIPSFSLWLGTLLAAELSALLVAWGGLAVYFGAPHRGPPAPTLMPIALGLVIGALGGGLFLLVVLLDRRGDPISHAGGDRPQQGSMPARPNDRERWLAAYDRGTRTLDRFLRVLLGITAVATFAGGVFLLVVMSSTSVDLLSRVVVAVATALLLGWLDSQFGRLAERRRPLRMSGPGESEYRRYQLRSGVLLLLATLTLVGLALLLP